MSGWAITPVVNKDSAAPNVVMLAVMDALRSGKL
jgi:hypothetical protein